MGQYHITANITKREFIHPHKIGMGMKLYEQAGEWIGTPHLIFLLLSASNGKGGGDFGAWSRTKEGGLGEFWSPKNAGRWAGDEIAVIGDYIQPKDLPSWYEREQKKKKPFKVDKVAGETYPENLYERIQKEWTDISDLVLKDYCRVFGLEINDKESGWREVRPKVR